MHKSELKVKTLSRVRLLATPWTAAYQAPPSMGFSRQEYWSGLPLPSLKWTASRDKYTFFHMEFEFEFNQSARSYLKKTRKNMVHSMFLIILRFKKNEKVLPGPLKNLIRLSLSCSFLWSVQVMRSLYPNKKRLRLWKKRGLEDTIW